MQYFLQPPTQKTLWYQNNENKRLKHEINDNLIIYAFENFSYILQTTSEHGGAKTVVGYLSLFPIVGKGKKMPQSSDI